MEDQWENTPLNEQRKHDLVALDLLIGLLNDPEIDFQTLEVTP